MCFIEYKKALDCIYHARLWIILKEMGVPVHLIVLLRKPYTKQEDNVRTEFGQTDTINIGKGVRQGCILSPLLLEHICRKHNEKGIRRLGWGESVLDVEGLLI